MAKIRIKSKGLIKYIDEVDYAYYKKFGYVKDETKPKATVAVEKK